MAYEILMPKLGLNMKEGKVIEWRAAEGGYVSNGQIVLTIETDKTNYELEAKTAGNLHILVPADQTVPVGQVLGFLAASMEEYTQIKTQVQEIPTPQIPKEEVTTQAERAQAKADVAGERVKIAPVARMLAKEHDIDVTGIRGTGPGGRIVKEDILRVLEEKKKILPSVGVPPSPVVKELEEGDPVKKRIPLVGMRKMMAEHMRQSLQVAAQVSASGTVEMTEMIKLRQAFLLEEKVLGFRVTYTDIFVKVVALTLKKHPILNSSIMDKEIVIWNHINIGVAVDFRLDEESSGLIVPVVRNADKKSIFEIHQTLGGLVEKARSRKLMPDDYSDNTFTLSNVGVFEVSSGSGTPILNQPGVGLLMTRPYEEKPVVREGQIVPRPMMDYSLTYDHRVVTGGDAIRFRVTFERLIQNPLLLLLY